MEKFDVVIIGSGPGGYVAAIRSGQLGLKTALVEKDKELGGTCLNVGCIPSKALLTSSDHLMFVKKEAAKHGIVIEGARADLAKMQERKNKVVKTFNSGVRSLMKTNKVTVLEGLGVITEPGKVSITSSNGQTQEVETRNIVIATGSAPVELPFAKFDGKTIVSSTEALEFTEAPKKLVVIGAGAIGLEVGSVWNRLGAEVTVLEFLPRIALGFDLELSNLLRRLLTGQGMTFHLEAKARAVKVDNSRALCIDDVEGMVKFVADAKTDRILGGHILHHAASELIAEAVSVIEFGGSSEDIGRTCHSHPTLSEAVREAALNVEKRALHI